MYPYILTETTLTIVIDTKSYSIESTNKNFKKVIKLINTNKPKKILSLLCPRHSVLTESTDFKIQNGLLYYRGKWVHNTVTVRIINAVNQGLPVKPLLEFLKNLLLNPCQASIKELYGFLEFGKLPITDDGHFLAYKKVNPDFTDIYTSSIDNSTGQIVQMPRQLVNNNKNDLCSSGLHFCSKDYLDVMHGNGPIMILKINPKDVVTIPTDYNNTKGRCCKYEVLHEYDNYCDPKTLSKIPKRLVSTITIIVSVSGRLIDQMVLNELKLYNPVLYKTIIDQICKTKTVSRATAVRYFKQVKDLYT
jgi:hypothetical protein